jgi:PD-(D/E)XK nuclease superfamily
LRQRENFAKLGSAMVRPKKSRPSGPAQSSSLTISAKTLGGLAMPRVCPRCFWLTMKAEGLPYQMPFPGIFSTLDSYGKRLVTGWLARHGSAPEWLAALGEISRSIPPPHYSKFFVLDEATSIVLRGTPDAVFQLRDGSYIIVDYKTAKFTAHQDELFPMYEAQLNAYAHIGERTNIKPVSGLALVYTEPVADDATTQDEANLTENGFRLGFSAHIVPVEIKPRLVPSLLRKARTILDFPKPPLGLPDCEDCAALAELFGLAGS